ncbi:MAG: sulfatase [Prolixibacteraceae bacterium]
MKIAVVGSLTLASFQFFGYSTEKPESSGRPNILFAISDDQSFIHTGFAGSTFIKTPAFDRVAREGVYFTNCIAGSPGCAPSRSSIVTGRYHWQNEQSGQHASSWMKKHVPFVDLLDANGYVTGRTGKGVGPFQYARDKKDSLWRATDAAGIAHSNIRYVKGTPQDERPAAGISQVDYFENFKYFMENVRGDQPFFFWYGATEPHRDYELNSWKRTGKRPEDVSVPGFLPDHEIVRGDLLDYAVEIEWFDLHLQRMLSYLEEIGELENTIVIVTSDNGMPFPRAKANSYEYGIHVPFAVRFPKGFPGGRTVDDPISFSDLAPTILELSKTTDEGMLPISGKSFCHLLESKKQGTVDVSREYVFSGRERHSSSRYRNWGYPQRVIRSREYLLIWNMKPDRWPAGAPQRIKQDTENELEAMYGVDENGRHHSELAFTDIDDAPTKSFIIENREDDRVRNYFGLAHDKRPEFELFDVQNDPACLKNLSGNQAFAEIERKMKERLLKELKQSQDPRIVGPDKEVFDSYMRYGPIREFPAPQSMGITP